MKEGKKSIVIDGVNEVDELTFVSHFAQGESNKIKELNDFKRSHLKQTQTTATNLSHFQNLVDDSDVSDSDVEPLDGDLSVRSTPQSRYYLQPSHLCFSQSYHDTRDPLDNLRIIDTVDLPDKVSDDLPIGKIGKCKSIFDDILIVESSSDSKVLDLGSIVCKHDRTILGTVNDTFGQTSSPYYMVILRNKNLKVETEEFVYCDVKHSTYITDENVESKTMDVEESEDEKTEELDIKPQNKLKQSYKDL
ncbi:hypothetical protein MACJ_000683 [Theileria orientalis]|uniref:H/ACA ribonucleoprotein complex subunit n=1 Tax=Theileria orientalis TaxID=68886 RepID=A0A976QRW4_THEOR|nr:hypothetical protein MACJ_000683 [Theileria orientalis]